MDAKEQLDELVRRANCNGHVPVPQARGPRKEPKEYDRVDQSEPTHNDLRELERRCSNVRLDL